MNIKKKHAANEFTIEIRPVTRWFEFHFRELLDYSDLLYFMVKRDILTTYAQTILGPLWYLFSSLSSVFVFVIVFGKIGNIPTDGIPHVLFYLSGLTLWNYFTVNLMRNSDFLMANAGVLSKIYFPRIIVPVSTVLANLVSFGIQFVLLIICTLFFWIKGEAIYLSWHLVWIPFIVLGIALFATGIGMFVSSVATYFRDVTQLIGLFTSLLMYASPVIYPASRIPEKWQFVFQLNPIVPMMEAFRYCLFGRNVLNMNMLVLGIFTIVVVFLFGFIVFNRIEKTFIDTV